MNRPMYVVDAMRDYFASTVPTMHGYIEEYGRESVQISIWLVGLATALLGFFVTMPKAFTLLPSWHFLIVILSLTLTVIAGLLQRLVYQVTENRMRQHLLGLRGHLSGAALAPHVVMPDELQDGWTVDDIVERIGRFFSVDYSFLAKPGTSLEFARDCYRGAFAIWQKYDVAIRVELGRTISAFTETSNEPKHIEALFTSLTPVDLRTIQSETDCIGRLHAAVRCIAFICYGAFAVCILAIAVALVVSLPMFA